MNDTATVHMTTTEAGYTRSAEVFGRTYSYTASPFTMSGIPGFAVRDEHGVLLAWFIIEEYACRWVDQMIERA